MKSCIYTISRPLTVRAQYSNLCPTIVKLKFHCYRWSDGQFILVWGLHLWSTTFITVRHLRPSCCGASFLTRGRVCNLLLQITVTLVSKFRRTDDPILLSYLRLPQFGGPGSRIYIPQEQGGQVIPPGTGLPFYRLLRLSGLRWRYSNPPPHGQTIVRVIVTLRLAVTEYAMVSRPLWYLWPDNTSCRKVAVWKLLFCLFGAPSLKRDL
jgi:hypothetical protein